QRLSPWIQKRQDTLAAILHSKHEQVERRQRKPDRGGNPAPIQTGHKQQDAADREQRNGRTQILNGDQTGKYRNDDRNWYQREREIVDLPFSLLQEIGQKTDQG